MKKYVKSSGTRHIINPLVAEPLMHHMMEFDKRDIEVVDFYRYRYNQQVEIHPTLDSIDTISKQRALDSELSKAGTYVILDLFSFLSLVCDGQYADTV